jgi:Flp pilus assembly protein TadG
VNSIKERPVRTSLSFISVIKSQRGVSAVVIAIALVVLLGFAALAIDVGFLYATRNELQNIADAAALAATRQLGATYQTLTPAQQKTYVCDPSTIVPIAQAVALKNQAAQKNIVINAADVVIGRWAGGTLTPTLNQPDAVGVIARRDGSANGPVTTFFAAVFKVFGGNLDTIGITADAVAALTGKGETIPGELELPIGISYYFYQDGAFCNDYVKFYPTNDPDSCAGWTSFEDNPPSDSTLRDILDELIDSPATSTSDPTVFNFTGGTLSNPTFKDLLTLFQNKGYDISAPQAPAQLDAEGNPVTGALSDGAPGTVPLTDAAGNRLYYPDGTPRNLHEWPTTVVVYNWDDCSNPNKAIEIVGYSEILVTDVLDAPNKLVQGKVLCNLYEEDNVRGGGGNFGIKGSIPGLVE